MEKTSAPADHRAIIVSVDLITFNKKYSENFNSDEFIDLAKSAGLQVEDHILSNQSFVSASHFLTKGKVEELRILSSEKDIKLVVLDCELSPSQERNLEKLLCARVLDRTGLILDIFAARAHSDIGKLQVELAQLSFLSTRLVRGWSHLERQKGGIGLRGPGETQLETDRRLIGKRIKRLNQKLEKSHKQKEINRYFRRKSRNKLVSLVGYTNAGKTTLFNKLTESSQQAEDKLFATLDSVTRKNKDPKHGPILFSDTVGFISDFPTQLIESFKATLDELKTADLLLHVVDSSDVDYKLKIKKVNKILSDIGVINIPQIIVNNKCDLVEHTQLDLLKTRRKDEVFTSAEKEDNFNDLRSKLNTVLFNGIYNGWISMENNLGNIRSSLFDMGCVKEEKISSCGKMLIKIKIGNDELDELLIHKGFELCHDEDILLKSNKA